MTDRGRAPTPRRGDDWLAGGGEMGERMRALDWSRTAVGPIAGWPESLRTIVRILLTSRYAMWLGWGPELTFFCNDAYRPTLGVKHTWALGAPAREVWAEIWPDIGPRAQAVLQAGTATWDEGLLLFLERSGYPEETYHTFSYSPAPDDEGAVGGMLCVVTEETQRLLGERRLTLLRELGASLATTHTEEEVLAALRGAVEREPRDLPFLLTYLLDADGRTARLGAAVGAAAGSDVAPLRLDLAAGAGPRAPWSPWSGAAGAAFSAPATGALGPAPVLVEDLAGRFAGLPTGPWDRPPRQAAVVRVGHQGPDRPAGLLVAGLNPYRPFDAGYQGFVDLLAGQVASGLANARAHEAERRRAEALAALDRAKSSFFSNASHELRTPLTLILGPLADALAAPARALAGEGLATAHRSALRLLKLTDSLLDVSLIEAERLSAAAEATDVARLTADLASEFRSAIEGAGLTLEVDCPALSAPVFVDPVMWEKIALNLVSNALKFTFEGSIRVALAERADHVELVVRDTGVGIAEEDLPRLFERFHQAPGRRGRTHEGTGVGLALVHELVRLHGGSIRAESRVGEGTTFTVTVPRGAPRPREPQPPPAGPRRREPRPPPAPPAPRLFSTTVAAYVQEAERWSPGAGQAGGTRGTRGDGRRRPAGAADRAAGARPAEVLPLGIDPGRRILLVDDNADMRDYLAHLLGQHWTVETAADGEEALEAAQREPPDLVLTDVMMPRLDGFGLLQALRADPALGSVPVLMLSARSGEEARVDGLAAGADDYLVKPFSSRELLARVASHLQAAAVRRAVEHDRAQLFELFRQAPIAVAVVRGPEHVFELSNPHHRATLGGRDVLGLKLREALPELAGSDLHARYDGVRASGQPYLRDELRVDLDRGRGAPEESYFSVSLFPVRDAGGQVERILVLGVDVTERVRGRRQLEQVTAEREGLLHREQEARRAAEAASRAKDEFLAMLGHELRNPLAPIVTALSLMRLRYGGVAEKERGVIERQVDHLTRLLEDLLDVSRVTGGKITLKRRRVEVSTIVARAVEIASPLLEKRRHHLTISVPPSGLVVLGDVTRLGQVVANLLTNAAKYTPKEGHLAVLAERAFGPLAEIVLRVRDDGIGIDPAVLPRVFDAFVQAPQALDRSQGGLGLGLAIVRSLVDLHGGTVSAYSAGRGQGTEVTVRLPVASEAAPEGAPDGAPELC